MTTNSKTLTSPKNWIETTLLEAIGNNNNQIIAGPFGSNLKVSDYQNEGVPILRLQNIDTNLFRNIDIQFISAKKAKELEYHSFKGGDIALAKLGDPVGKTCIIPESFLYGIVVSDVVRIRINENLVDKFFIVELLNSSEARNQLYLDVIGTTRPRVNLSKVRNLRFIFPPKDEQRKIGEILKKLNNAINETESLINKYRSIKQGLLQDLFKYGIDEHGQIRNEKIHKFKDSPLGKIPVEWNYSTIGSSYLKGRIGWQGLTTKEYLDDGNYYLVTGTDFDNGKIQWDTCHFVEEKRYSQDPKIQLKEGDILVTKDGTIGKVAYVEKVPLPATLNSGVFVVRPFNKEYIPKYLYYVLRSFIFDRFIDNLSAGSTIKHLYQKDFVKFVFPLPKKEEQEAIIKLLEIQDHSIEYEEKNLMKLQHIKQGLMQDLLTGKVRVNHLLN